MPRNWMKQLRQRLARTPNRKALRQVSRNAESLEQRTYLSVTSLFVNGELQILSDGPDNIVVDADPAGTGLVRVTVNGSADTTLPPIQPSIVQAISVVGSDSDNVIDVSGVTAAAFPFVDPITNLGVQISVDGDDGNDTITGSLDLGGTLDGGNGADTITGLDGADSIDGGDGADSINAGAGNDTVTGDDGSDTIDGGTGNDVIDSGDGQDSVIGDTGNDTINSGDGADTVDGGAGADSINGMSGEDSLSGGVGADSIFGGSENDVLDGGDGDDFLNGQAGDDTANGSTGNDTALGGGGRDSLLGGDGDDILNGQSGNDTLAGESGMDRLYGGSSNDVLDGGADDDTLRGHSGDDTIFGGTGNDLMKGDRNRDLLISDTPEIASRGTVTLEEGDSGTTSYSISVELNQSYPIPISFTVTPTSVTALAVSDFESTPFSITFAPGQLLQSFNVGIVGDTTPEPTELFDLVFTPSPGFVGGTSSISIRINDDDQFNVNVSQSTFNQTETSVQSNPTNPSNILASGTDLSNATQDTVWQSLDGGLTWTPISIPNSPGILDAVGDAALAFNSSGTAFFAHGEAYSTAPLTGLPIIQAAVATSVDSGTTWTTAVVPLPAVPNASVGDISLTIGPDPVTPGIERLYLSYEVDGTQYAQTSLDGIAWSSAVPVQDAGRGGNVTTVSGPDGTLYALWQEIDPLTPGASRILFDRSVDGGLTWGTDTSIFATTVALDNDSESVISDGALNSYLVPSAADYGAGSFVSAAVDRSNSAYRGRIYVVVSDQSDQDGVAATQHDDTDLFLISSDDQGQTWSSPLLINDDASGNTQLAPEIAVDQSTGDLVVAWYDARLDDSSSATGDTNGLQNDDVHVFVAVSFDGGASFESNLRLSAAASNAEQALLFNAEIANRGLAQWSSAIGGNDHWFDGLIPANRVTWDEALVVAPTIRGYLATLVTQAENDFAFNNVVDDPTLFSGNQGPWIGAIQNQMSPNFAEPAGGFEWITGEAFVFANWGTIVAGTGTNEPNNGGPNGPIGREDAVQFLNGIGPFGVIPPPLNTWHDAPRAAGLPSYLAEFDHNPVALDYGDHIGLSIQNGAVNVAWANNSNSTGDNPDGTLGGQDIYLATLALRSELTIATVSASGNDTILGGTQNDTIIGGDGNDLLDGNADEDIISGGGGNDSIRGGAGHDTLNGGTGDDTLDGQGGNDLVDGESGNDVISWMGLGDGDDTVTMDDGGDTLLVSGDETDETFSIGQTDNTLVVSEGSASISVTATGIAPGVENVVLNAAGGDDIITVTSVDQVGFLSISVNGGNDDDTITATGALLGRVKLSLNGDAGNDTITGSAEGDTIQGGDGDDMISGDDGDDTLQGGPGNDSLSGGNGNDLIEGEDGNDTALGDAGDDSLLGSFGNDVLLGGDGDDTARGGFGSDALNGMAGNDSLLGEGGSDRIAGGSGDDTIDGGRDDDTIQGHSGADLIDGNHGDDFIRGQAGDDTILGDDGDDTIAGDDGRDLIFGQDGDDVIDGNGASDTIVGGDGNDILLGGGSNDTILGEQGDDTINGNSGTDLASTGEGADTVSDVEIIDESFTLSATLLSGLDA